jgi:alcohol dehydrogenase YqhD (iron-dependent ADH family)
LEAFFVSLGMPVRLSQANIGDDKLMEMANKAPAQTRRYARQSQETEY